MRKGRDGLINYFISQKKDAMVAFLLKILSVLYPFIADCTSVFRSALVIHIAGGIEMREIVNYFRGFGLPQVKMLGDTPKRFEQTLQVPEYGLLMFEYSHSRYTERNIEQLVDFCHRTSLDDVDIQPLVLVLTDRPIPVRLAEQFAGDIYLHELPTAFPAAEEHDTVCHLIKTVINSQDLIRSRIKRVAENTESGICVFQAVSICIKSVVECWGADEEQLSKVSDLLEEGMKNIREKWEPSGDPAFFIDAFRHCFIRWIEDTSNEDLLVLDRRRIEGWAVGREEDAILFDDNYYCLSLDTFREICTPISKDLGFSYIKTQLELAGLIECERVSRTYYTKKVETVNVFGHVKELRRMKIRREKIDEQEEMTILEMILSRGGEDHEYDSTWYSSDSKQNRLCLGESK